MLTVAHTWLGITQTFSPILAGEEVFTYPCSSFILCIRHSGRSGKRPKLPTFTVASLEKVLLPPSTRHCPGTAVLTTVTRTRSAHSPTVASSLATQLASLNT